MTSSKKVSCITYARVSSREQKRGDGPDRQIRAMRDYAKRNNLNIVESYFDGGVSGAKELKDRPQLARLLARVATNGVEVVLLRSRNVER